ncbi:MAG TPA: carboxypeptidase regulatory-like domain-containing protein, partial [Streptosporangiaceae bacterium]|nr:carboxypeptidase regulatory-like domain-containing protein [Streptosporangiaceae bacterium]
MTGTTAFALVTMLAAGPAQATGPVRPPTGAVGGGPATVAPRLATDTNAPCNAAPKPGQVRCFAVVRTPASHSIAAAAAPAQDGPPTTALSPADIQSAYHLPATGAGQTVAIVDALGDSSAESDLAEFRSFYGLPPCTTANGCFRKVDQTGGTNYPPDDPGWGLETSLDLDAVSSACPACNILLVQGNTASIPDLAAAEDEAVALGAKFISNSYGAGEDPSLLSFDSSYNHPGVAITASSGDTGDLVIWPSSDPDVTSVGGTLLTRDASTSRGWNETAWASGGSGCSAIEPQPQNQLNLTTDCTMRATADISADADPASGLGIFDTLGEGGWLQVGGTSLASPLMASMYALAGVPVPGTNPVDYPYHDPAQSNDIFDVSQGSNGSCGNLLCNAGPGWDGPTGLGTPDGVGALSGGPQGQISGQVSDASTGDPVVGATVTADPGNYATRTDSSGHYILDVTAGTYTVSAATYAFKTSTTSGVQVSDNATVTANFSLTELPHATVSGTVKDGSGHGWPLYAKITIGGGYPGGPIYTDPFTGRYSVELAGPATYPVQITAAQPAVFGSSGNGYQEQDAQISVGTTAANQDYSLSVNKSACTAPGYGPAGLAATFTPASAAAAGWTVSGTKSGWRFDNPGNRPTPGVGVSDDQFAIADSGTSGGRMDTTLTSPSVDLSGQSAPVVSFKSGYYGGSGQQAEVDLSTNSGKTWTTIWHQSTANAVGSV